MRSAERVALIRGNYAGRALCSCSLINQPQKTHFRPLPTHEIQSVQTGMKGESAVKMAGFKGLLLRFRFPSDYFHPGK